MPFRAPTTTYLLHSALLGTWGTSMFALSAVDGSGVLPDGAASVWERLGTAGLLVTATALMLRWALGEMRRQAEEHRQLLAAKDAAIAAISDDRVAGLKESNLRLVEEMRALAASRMENTLAMRDLTTAITSQRVACLYTEKRGLSER